MSLKIANTTSISYQRIASQSSLALAVSIPTFFLATPWLLATLNCLFRRRSIRKPLRSAMYAGRVWHTRFLPTKHAFQYPLFLFCLDLREIEDGLITSTLGFLRWIVALQERDHLKDYAGYPNGSLRERVQGLVAEKTNQAFRPTEESHRFLLVTHLMYYGYCFNPVSFYYIQNKETEEIEAMVGEVSNTPWNEMYCYVLHPDSLDAVTVSGETTGGNSMHYTFPKAFHVSPFMEMHYNYEWTFHNFSTETTNSIANKNNSTTSFPQHTDIRVVNNLRHRSNGALQFHARMQLERRSLHALCIAWYMSLYPMHCVLVQLWIHYEAFRLFLKGIAYQPHPEGSETTASRWIGAIMTPLFALQDRWDAWRRRGDKETAAGF